MPLTEGNMNVKFSVMSLITVGWFHFDHWKTSGRLHFFLCLSAKFLHSEQYTCPSHAQPVSPWERCEKLSKALLSPGRQHPLPFACPLSESPCHRRRSVKQNQTFINPCWPGLISWLSCTCIVDVLLHSLP